jgi:histidinol-phosphate aminotransferase
MPTASSTTHPSIRSHLAALPAYTPIEPFEVLSARLGRTPDKIIKLDANENPYGPSPRARQVLAGLEFPHIYPDPESRALRTALSKFTSLPMENLLAGAGADELIDLLLRVFIEPGDCVLSCPPTFGMYPFDTRLNAGRLVELPRKPDFSLDLIRIQQAVKEYSPKIIFLATPNNPDGSLLPTEIIETLLSLPVMIVLDEAYIEFSDQGRLGQNATWLGKVIRHENLVVLRTFSKWAGLAGLRVGYGAFPGWLMPVLWKSKQPYNINVAASQAAIATLEEIEYQEMIVTRVCEERRRLYSLLQEIHWLQPYPSQSNFILCKVLTGDAVNLKADLASQYGVLVRYFNSPGLQDHIRISIGRPSDTDALMQALRRWQTF